MIGVYNYTVIATYVSLFTGLSGIFLAMQGSVRPAFLCLMLSGLLDAFDGRIARTKKDRSDSEKRYGIQIDSLNDVVCFGVLPAAIGFAIEKDSILFLAVMQFYVLAALIRLGYFNVMEEERQDGTSDVRTYYLGMPVTAASFLAPLAYLAALLFHLTPFVVYAVALFVYGVLFITPMRVRKLKLPGILAMTALGAVTLVLLFVL